MVNDKNKSSTGKPRLLRQVNLQAVIREMRRCEVFSKIDLARYLEISTTTMTKLFAQLETSWIIQKSPEEDTSFGRPKVFYQLSPALQVGAIVIDVETTTISFSDLQGTLDESNQTTFSTGKDKETLFEKTTTEFNALRKRINASCKLVGVCIPGLIEQDSGISKLNPNLPWLEGINPADELGARLKLPAVIMHEERALGRAQMRVTDDVSDYITMDFSSGVGMSVVSGKNYLVGTSGFAGEIGHVVMDPGGDLCGCGNRGCLETIASDRVFQRDAALEMDEALKKLKENDPVIRQIADRVAVAQARGVAAVVNIFNPEKIFVFSRLSEAYPDYVKTLREAVSQLALSLPMETCTIETTHEGKLKGAVLLTIDILIEQLTKKEGAALEK